MQYLLLGKNIIHIIIYILLLFIYYLYIINYNQSHITQIPKTKEKKLFGWLFYRKKIVCKLFLFVGYLLKYERTTKGRTSNRKDNAKHKLFLNDL